MNSYSLAISISWAVAILLFIAAAALTFYTYRITVPPVSGRKKALLMSLRAIALFLLLFIVYEPIMTIISGSEKAPEIVVMLDNSLSAGMKDGTGERTADYKKALDNSGLDKLDNDQVSVIKFSEGTEEIFSPSFDSLDFSGQSTNISRAIRKVTKSAAGKNLRAALLVTDGAFNEGTNPVYDAGMLGRPVYVFGIGDTVSPKDASVKSILTNETAYIDNPVPVNVDVEINGYSDGELLLELFDGNKKISEQQIFVSEGKTNYPAMFEYIPDTEGYRKLTAKLGTLENELTEKNNSASVFINVLKNKRKIAIFAGAPSPDLSFIKNELKNEKGVKFTEFIQKKGPEYYNDAPNPSLLNDAEFIVFIGYPIASTRPQDIEMIARQLEAGKPLLFIAAQNTDYNKLKKLEEYLPFRTVSSNIREFMAIPEISDRMISHPVLRINGTDDDKDVWNQLPPLFRTETFVTVKPESRIVAGFKVNNVAMKDPLIVSRDFNDKKSLAVLGYGLYRWKLLAAGADRSRGQTGKPDLFRIFVQNSLRWLSVSNRNKKVIIKSVKSNYTESEKIEFSAQVYDDSYNPVDNAKISVSILGEGEKRDISLSSYGNGRYSGSAEGFASGDYAFSGSAELEGRKLGSDRGRFSVGELNLEYRDMTMNINLLRNIANESGGKFYLPDETDKFINDLLNDRNFQARPITLRSETALWDIPWLLAGAILCFGIEWLVRKRSGML